MGGRKRLLEVSRVVNFEANENGTNVDFTNFTGIVKSLVVSMKGSSSTFAVLLFFFWLDSFSEASASAFIR